MCFRQGSGLQRPTALGWTRSHEYVLLTRGGHDHLQIHRIPHRQIAGAVRVQRVAGAADVLFGWNSARRPPVCGSRVAASKSATPSNRPPVRMNALTACRRVSTSGVPAAVVAPSAEVIVAPIDANAAVRAEARDALLDPGDRPRRRWRRTTDR